MRAQKYKTEAEKFGWSFVFQDFVSDELKSKITQRIEVFGYRCKKILKNICRHIGCLNLTSKERNELI